MSDQQDQKDYQDYVAYQNYLSAHNSPKPSQVNVAPTAFGTRGVGITNVNPADVEKIKNAAIKSAPTIGATIGSFSPIPGGTLLGALGGSAIKQYYNPPPSWPVGVYRAGQDAIINAGLPWALSKTAGLGAAAIRETAAQHAANEAVKDISNYEPMVQNEVNNANQQYIGKTIGPRMLEQQARLSDQTLRINPDDFIGISPKIDSEMNTLKAAIEKGGGVSTEGIEIPGNAALELRADLNDAAKFGPQYIGDVNAAAKVSAARDAGDVIRSGLAEADPNIPLISSELQKDYALQKAVMGNAAKNPSGVIQGTNLGKQSRLAQFDEAAGSNLSDLGQRAMTAQRILGKSDAANKLGGWQDMLLNKAKDLGYESLGPVSSVIEPYSTPILDPLANVIDTNTGRAVIRGTPWMQIYNNYKENNQ